MKKTILFLMAIFLMIGACGCMKNNESSIIVEQACSYLQNKYNQEFKVVSYIDKSIDVPFEEIYLQTEQFPEEIVTVYRDKDADRKGFCLTDNFYGIIIKDEYEAKLHDIIDTKLQCKFYFNFTASYFPDELNSSVSLDEALCSYSDSLFANIFIFFPKNNDIAVKADWKGIDEELRINGLTCYFAVYEVQETDYGSINKDNYKDYLSDNYQLNSIYSATIR